MTFVWGSTFVITKGSLTHISQMLFVAIRFVGASFILAILYYKILRKLTLRTFIHCGFLGVLLFAGFLCQNVGILYTTASKSAFFTGTMVVMVPIVQFIVDRRLPRLGNLLGVLFAGLGLYLLTSPQGAEFNKGDGLTLICAGTFAVYIVYLDHISNEFDKIHITFSQIAVVAIFSLIGMLFYRDMRFEYSPGLVVALLYLTIFATLITTLIQSKFQGDTLPTRAAIIFTTEPVIAAILAYYFRGEMIGIAGIIGGCIIIAGLLISELSDSIPFMNRALSTSTD